MATTISAGRGPRLRFAPSPTGHLHVGNARTALINWLVARRSGGCLVLRIEDTDPDRQTSGTEATILEDLTWLGLDWDEGPDKGGAYGPYRQSKRFHFYQEAVDSLLKEGSAYLCFCSREAIEAARVKARERGLTFRYPGTCRNLSTAEVERRAAEESSVVRFRVRGQEVRFVDGLRGEIGVAVDQIGDFILLRSDRSPTYNLVCVVDDHAMCIDHVIRGEDHLSNTPRQILLYRALGFCPPAFTHLPLVLGADRGRLSKRHGATSVAELRAAGILPAALCNFLALLGWSAPAGREVLSLEELRKAFQIDTLASANVVFDVSKLEWLNSQHLKRLSAEEVVAAAAPHLQQAGYPLPTSGENRRWWGQLIDLVRSGCRRLDELPAAVDPVLQPDLEAIGREPTLRTALTGDRAEAVLRAFAAASDDGELGSEGSYRSAAQRIGRSTGARGRELFHPLRVAISGDQTGPELARLVPIIESGARLPLHPPVLSVAERIAQAMEVVGLDHD
ncbi:MAG: glutamate--tRNA ligase [Acidobacteriota bacterium]